MKYIKMLGLLAIAASALMAFVVTASAATATAPPGTLYTGKIHAVSTNFTFHGDHGTVSCESTLDGNITGHVSGGISTLHFKPCVGGSVHVSGVVPTPGSLEIDSAGTVTWKNGTVTLTIFGFLCGYTPGAAGVHFGTLTDASSAVGHAVLDIKATVPRTEGSVFCGATGKWTGSYKVTTPTGFIVD